jgi:Mor family transcriptional regulator
MTDFVHDMISRIRDRIATAYGLPDEVEDLLGQVEAEIKHEFGGNQVYIQQGKADKARIAEAVKRDYLADLPIEHITRRHSISRTQMYKLLKR